MSIDGLPILILSGRAPVALDLARCFSKSGATVYVADSLPIYLCQSSNAVAKSFKLPSPKFDLDRYKESILEIISTYQVKLIIPTCEEIFHFAKIIPSLPKECTVFSDSFEKLIKLHDKLSFIDWLNELKCKTPKTMLLKSTEDLRQIVESHSKWLLKPRFSRFADEVIFPESVLTQAKTLDLSRGWIAQEFLTGRHLSSYSIVYQGKILAHTNYSNPYRFGGGSSLYFKHEQHEEAYSFVESLVSKIDFHGQIGFDYVETDDGLFPIECNPRSTSGVHILKHVEYFSGCFLGTPITLDESPKSSMIGIGMVGLFVKHLRTSSITRFLKDLLLGKDVIFSLKDLMPFFLIPFSLLSFFNIARKHRLTLSEAMTYDIAFNEDSK